MIYKVNGYNLEHIYYVADQITLDEAKVFNPNLKYIIGSQIDAQAALEQKQKDVLAYEAVRFSICATFINGNDTVWREVQDSDPEDTICQVFDTFTGQYTQCSNKTDAYALNEQKKQEFLTSVGLDKIHELDSIPAKQIYSPLTYGTTVGDIPVEVM